MAIAAVPFRFTICQNIWKANLALLESLPSLCAQPFLSTRLLKPSLAVSGTAPSNSAIVSGAPSTAFSSWAI
ncbi:MAG: hypothetical protein AAB267_01360 [Candidatus Desantisbacteria bacterium]